ncbi:SDR family NAD(P)-dependent oxidoreductase [Brevibacterium renqingii]|uniref:SDR family NAD(P)-dependent oxidoreductase n=1 Tax=Brevibacterium renqingii TaxID=2776916 RepID=UPI001ADF4A49|nr:glucose 1-dehydrogenase [Brevibacterium renqingii]
MTDLRGKNGFVTAAGSGIGRASAMAFAEAGAAVLVTDIDGEAVEETCRLIRAEGGTAEGRIVDASSEDDAAAVVEEVVSRWGSLDFAHNHAGLGAAALPFSDQDRDDWQRLFDVNVFGLMGFMKHELRQMATQGSGAIVNTSSMSGKNGSPGLSPYNASKWAVNGMTQTAALEYAAQGIRVNAICPAATMTAALSSWAEASPEEYRKVTEAIPMKRMASPQEQAAAAVWLCSDDAGFVTGTLLNVDGGDGILGKQ